MITPEHPTACLAARCGEGGERRSPLIFVVKGRLLFCESCFVPTCYIIHCQRRVVFLCRFVRNCFEKEEGRSLCSLKLIEDHFAHCCHQKSACARAVPGDTSLRLCAGVSEKTGGKYESKESGTVLVFCYSRIRHEICEEEVYQSVSLPPTAPIAFHENRCRVERDHESTHRGFSSFVRDRGTVPGRDGERQGQRDC